MGPIQFVTGENWNHELVAVMSLEEWKNKPQKLGILRWQVLTVLTEEDKWNYLQTLTEYLAIYRDKEYLTPEEQIKGLGRCAKRMESLLYHGN